MFYFQKVGHYLLTSIRITRIIIIYRKKGVAVMNEKNELKQKFTTNLKIDTIKNLKMISAYYNFDYKNEAIEYLVEEKYNQLKKEGKVL